MKNLRIENKKGEPTKRVFALTVDPPFQGLNLIVQL